MSSEAGPQQESELTRSISSALVALYATYYGHDRTTATTYINDNTPDRQVIYEDPELGFCICGHLNRGAKEANPHDHGSSWAIYGQAFGETEMSEWEIVEPASEAKPGKVRRTKVYSLKPGMAHLYNESEVHSPKRVAATGLIRAHAGDAHLLRIADRRSG